METVKVGLVSCSGEEFSGGTVTRLAVRKVMDKLRKGKCVTLCFPLFLAGGEGERTFAKLNPTITIDGCEKLCAKRGTEMYSGKVEDCISVPELLKDRTITEDNLYEIVDIVAEEIVLKVDKIIGDAPDSEKIEDENPSCSCFSSPRPFTIDIEGEKIDFLLLPKIFLKLKKQGEKADKPGEDFMKEIKIYNYIPSDKESAVFKVLK
ncbi:MAG: putative zinc-binding protein, partial [Candidatus Eremiobacterota bacterium]